ncbi:MAG: CRTAC1 family protein [Gemmataceae bacterium]
MNGSLKQLILFLLFIVPLGGFFGYKYLSKGPVDQQPLEGNEALRKYGFYLKEVSKECGIDFTHQAPTLDAKLDHIMPQIASMGASVSIVDFDKDGWLDIYIINSGEGSKNRLYRNMHDGTFKDVAEEMGVADLNQLGAGVCMGAVWGDFDNDGYEDLLVYKWGKPLLFHNNRGKGFTLVDHAKTGLPDWANINSAIWVDFNRDGHLDLFLAGYWPENIDLWHLRDTKMMTESFEYAKNGGRKYLLRNRGDGTFEDVTEKMGITSTRWTLAVGAADLCGTGYPDLFLANDYGVSEVYANQNGEGFIDIAEKCGIAKNPKSGMNVSFGDIYNQGRSAVYVSNISEPGNIVQGNNFWVPQAGTSGDNTKFMNQANGLGVELGGWSWGAQFGDLNNDGLLDLYLVNGYVSADKGQSYWYDFAIIAGDNTAIISDAKNWPAMKGRSLSGYQHKCVWLGKGGKFVDVGQAIGVTDTFDGRAIAMADLWNRGVLDVVVANQKGPLLLYKNTVSSENEWIEFDLEGIKSNKSAIGTKVRLFWDGKEQVQEVSGGSGYASQNMRRLHFGLGKNPKLEKAIIEWPSGRKQTLESLKPRMIMSVREE